MTKIVYQDRYNNNTPKPEENPGAQGLGSSEENWDYPLDSDFEFPEEEGRLDRLQNKPGRPVPQEANIDSEMEAWLENKQKTENKSPLEEDAKFDPEENEDGEFKLKKGVRYYDSKDPEKGKGYDFELNPTGDRIKSVVSTEGSVTINLGKEDIARLSQTGNKLIVQVGKERIEIDLNQASGVHFVGGNVEGDVDNGDKKITTNSGIFLSSSEIQAVKDKIAAVIDQISTPVYDGGEDETGGIRGTIKTKYGLGWHYQTDDNSHAKKGVAKAKEFFQAMSKAMDEKDPKERKDLWLSATEILQDFIANDADGGKANNLGHLVGNILLSEFGGKEGLLDVFEKGLLPAGVAEVISTALKAKNDENTQLGDVVHYQWGGQASNMTHASLAMIFDRAAKASGPLEA